MTTPVDICNRALSEIGSRVLISSLTDTSNAAITDIIVGIWTGGAHFIDGSVVSLYGST